MLDGQRACIVIGHRRCVPGRRPHSRRQLHAYATWRMRHDRRTGHLLRVIGFRIRDSARCVASPRLGPARTRRRHAAARLINYRTKTGWTWWPELIPAARHATIATGSHSPNELPADRTMTAISSPLSVPLHLCV